MNVEPLPELGVERDLAAALGHDAVHRRESEPGSLLALRREERLEDVRRGCGVDSRASVAHAQQRMTWSSFAVEIGSADADRQLAAAGHAVAPVDREVDDHLLELAAIGLHDHRWLRERRHEPTFSPMSRCRSPSVCRTTSFRSSTSGFKTCLRPNASNCFVRSAPRSADREYFLEILGEPVITLLKPAQRELAVAANRDEQVVEIVCDAAGQLSDRLELLCLAQTRLERLQGFAPPRRALLRERRFSHVDSERHRADDCITQVAQFAVLPEDEALVAGLGQDRILEPFGQPSPHRGVQTPPTALDSARAGAGGPSCGPASRSRLYPVISSAARLKVTMFASWSSTRTIAFEVSISRSAYSFAARSSSSACLRRDVDGDAEDADERRRRPLETELVRASSQHGSPQGRTILNSNSKSTPCAYASVTSAVTRSRSSG